MERKKFDMPNNLKARVNKRMTCFMEHLSKKKHKSRVDVYMEHLKLISSKEIYDIDDKDVLKFLIFLRMLMTLAELLCLKTLSTFGDFPLKR